MIEAWFNERGFKVITSKGDSRFIYELPSVVVDNAAALYASRWMVLNHMMDIIVALKETIEDRDLALYTDSRLVEELQGDITTESGFAKASLRYFVEEDFVSFRRVTFHKCSPATINGKISEPIDQARPATT